MYFRRAAIFLVAFLGHALVASAKEHEPLIGAELEFTNREIEKGSRSPNIVNSPIATAYKNRFKKLVMAMCEGCVAEHRKDAYGVPIWRIVFPDKWWFEITTDPATLEIKTKPSTARRLQRVERRMQRYIFDVAHELGTVGRYEENSAGHLHIGVRSAFGTDTKLFRNFVVDYANHPGLAAGALYKDYYN